MIKINLFLYIYIVTILLALSFLRGTAGGGSSVAPPPPAPVPRSSTPFCRLLSFGGSSGGLSSASLGGLAPGTRVSSLSNMASRSGPLSSNLGLPSSSGLSSFGNCGNGYRLYTLPIIILIYDIPYFVSCKHLKHLSTIEPYCFLCALIFNHHAHQSNLIVVPVYIILSNF